jgi:hypothetical protein
VVDVHRQVDRRGDCPVVLDRARLVDRVVVRGDDHDTVRARPLRVLRVPDRLAGAGRPDPRDDRHLDTIGNRLDHLPALRGREGGELAVCSERKHRTRAVLDDEPGVCHRRRLVDLAVGVEGGHCRRDDTVQVEWVRVSGGWGTVWHR